MENQIDEIIPISPKREKFFGCSGRMLLPSPATIAALIQSLPDGTVITTDLLQGTLAARAGVEVACPVTTRKALQTIAKDTHKKVAYWRVLKKNGELLAIFPGGAASQAALLEGDGFTIDTHGKNPKVANYKESLVQFG